MPCVPLTPHSRVLYIKDGELLRQQLWEISYPYKQRDSANLEYFMWACLRFTCKGPLVISTAQKCVFSFGEENGEKKKETENS